MGQDEYLLYRNKIDISEKKKLEKKELRSNIEQQPNNRILGLRFHLSLYNLSNINKDRGMHKWLRKVGEAPVIFNSADIAKSEENIESYLDTRGYLDARVSDTVEYSGKKAEVKYNVNLNQPYRISGVSFQVDDPVIGPWVLADSNLTRLKTGNVYELDDVDAERLRIEKLLKNKGYFWFRKEYISFEADSNRQSRTIDFNVHVTARSLRLDNGQMVEASFRKYRLGDIYFFVDHDPAEALKDPAHYYNNLDTTEYKGFYFVTSGKSSRLHPDVVLRANYLYVDELYNHTNVEQTRMHLSGLAVIRNVDVQFSPRNEQHYRDTTPGVMDCSVQISQNKLQSYTVELEGTNSSGNLGASLNFLYQHKNLFNRAEVLNLKLNTSYEALPKETSGYGAMKEYGAEAGIIFPRFLLPFLKSEDFVKKYNPKTNLFNAYNFQHRPEYERTMFISKFGYQWQGNKYVSHIVTPIDMNVIKLPYIDSSFITHIDTTSYLAYSYKNTFVAGLSYSFIYTNKKMRSRRDYYYFRFNFSTSGNLVDFLDKSFSTHTTGTGNEVFGIEYSQYVKGDADLIYSTYINDKNSIVYRGFIGAGLPYGNSRALPFEKQYYTGGANDIRAWPVRALGPGSHQPDRTTFYNQTADMKLNFNLEYRFKIFWVLEGALFVDAGNIWAITPEDTRPGARFHLNSFVKDLAVGSGVGTRFDFSYFLFRLDFGFKMRDPMLPDSNKWVVANPGYDFSQMTFHLAIGYPF